MLILKYNCLMMKAIQSLSFVACLLFTSLSAYAHTSVTDLRVQHLAEPLAVEDAHPLFSWRMESDVAGQEQKAYRLAVVRECDQQTVWDSGRMESGLSDNIRYLGVALQPEMGYSWTVMVWDAQGGMHVASSRFETGLMNPSLAAWEGATFTIRCRLCLALTIFACRMLFRTREIWPVRTMCGWRLTCPVWGQRRVRP